MSFTGSELFGVRLKDDVTAVTQKMANSLVELNRDVKMLGDSFKKTNTGNLTVGLKEAEKLFKNSAGNMKLFSNALKDAGVSALDAKLLVGKFSAEVTAARRAALGMSGILDRVFDPKTIWRLSHALNVLSKGFGVVQFAASSVFGVMQTGANYAQQGVESVLDHATKRQNIIESMAYTFQKGDVKEEDARKEAKGAFSWAQGMAKDTPLDTNVVTDALNQFLTGDFTLRQSKILTTVMADQAAKHLDKAEMPQNVINAFTRIKAKGHSSLEDFESLRTARFDPAKVRDEMAKLPEVKAKLGNVKDKDTRDKKLDKLMSAGSIDYMSTIQGAINSLEADKPALGTLSKKLGGTSLQGTISNLKAAWGDLLQSQDIQDSPGIKSLQDFMNRVSGVMAGTSESGKRLYKIITETVANLTGGLDKITDSDIDRFLTKVGEAALEASKWVKEAWTWFDKLLHADAGFFLDAVGDVLLDVGAMIGAGIKKGFMAGADALAEDRYQKKHGISRGEIQYQAKLSNRSEAEVLADFKARDAVRSGRGIEVNTPWGGDQNRERFNAAMKQNLAVGAMEPGSGVLASSGTSSTWSGVLAPAAYEQMFDLNTNLQQLNAALGTVPQMAEGGMVSRPTLALIGEAGPEAVVPLSRITQMIGGSSNRSVSININAGSGDAARQWEAMRPAITQELTAILVRVGNEG